MVRNRACKDGVKTETGVSLGSRKGSWPVCLRARGGTEWGPCNEMGEGGRVHSRGLSCSGPVTLWTGRGRSSRMGA